RPAQGAALLDTAHLHAELGGPDGGNVASRTAANYDEVKLLGHDPSPDSQMMPSLRLGPSRAASRGGRPCQISSNKRSGRSTHSLTGTKNGTASRPSTIRWS